MTKLNEDSIINKVKTEENRSIKRMFLYTSIPLVLTVLLIIVSWFSVNKANEKVNQLNEKVYQLDEEIGDLEIIISEKSDSIKTLQKIYEFALNYRDQRFNFSYSIDKVLFSRYPRQTEMLIEVREMISDNSIKWKLGGNSSEEGFDSPSFASYMLSKHSSTHIPVEKTYKLFEFLEKIDHPQIGDIVFYEHGYTMFYFEYENRPFCVGMTPVGVASLKLDFGPEILGYGKVNY